uniref:Neurotransmitter-gated ion-channel ligand-binding domain-containing protein n=1 Tax=Chromera velia CCMP2878 TaxID=1169474 RepID=A0A0G4HUB3_9ALVE|eukprot:Cvel_1378.t1-p1 / transcript=Cvel_1378.t1 / gene=Cvel_1378 / organism=Chromera_velia_CCMP2878 / gene_product=Gamma-aminobutyric acid receptor subunit alpha-1, putative / transcript_product=Gamma-aminobutyric acid receptor subunit alpha-1, putative / location=Cvel_scaffold47:144986-147511(-) / protein_length=483 / sequence_SO=supercontig / SO=protein_coding / is_pseudo=false
MEVQPLTSLPNQTEGLEGEEMMNNLLEEQTKEDEPVTGSPSAAFKEGTFRTGSPDDSHDHAGAKFTANFLKRLHPPLDPADIEKYRSIIIEHDVQISDIPALGHEGLSELGFASPVHRARLLAATDSSMKVCSDPPKINGEPVEVQVKIGMTHFGNIDTVMQTAAIKFFFDLHWIDPSVKGLDPASVPSYIWTPDAYVLNALGGDNKQVHPPVLLDSERGLMLQALEFETLLHNPMDLREFPFDADMVEVHMVSSESHPAEDFVFSEWKEDVTSSVKCFFSKESVAEWELRGFSVDCFVSRGGNGVNYSDTKLLLHLRRRSSFYIWKIVLPLVLSTAFCFSSFFFETENLTDRNATSLTMFLTTAAVLFVVGSLLPKTSFLTTIDKFVVVNLFVQFTVAVLSWVLAGGFGEINPEVVETTEFAFAVGLSSTFFLATIWFFVPPIVYNIRLGPNTPPLYPVPSFADPKKNLSFHRFEEGVNVFC